MKESAAVGGRCCTGQLILMATSNNINYQQPSYNTFITRYTKTNYPLS